MPMPPYPSSAITGCGQPGRLQDRRPLERRRHRGTEDLRPELCGVPARVVPASCNRQAACRLTRGETLEPPGIYLLQRGQRDQKLPRLADMEEQLRARITGRERAMSRQSSQPRWRPCSGRRKSRLGCIAFIATRNTTAIASNGGSRPATTASKRGFWCCPIPGCDGRGFCFDIFPTDPEWRDEHGERVWVDGGEEDLDDADLEDAMPDESTHPNGQAGKPPSPDDLDIPF